MKLNMYKVLVCHAYLNQKNPAKKTKIFVRYEKTINEINDLLKEYEKFSKWLQFIGKNV